MRRDAHRQLTRDASERAAIYVLGGMQDDEIVPFEEHLAGCATCRDEVSQLEPLLADLALATPEADPPAALRERVLARAGSRPLALRRADEHQWLASDVPGVEITQLWLDAEQRRHTALLRMASGASLPTHRHGGPEECYVVAGDLRDRDLVLRAGDYVRHDEGTQHSLTTQSGCLLLITGSLDDRRVVPT